ncbi:FAD-binding oxidoreductase [Corynebacterium guangdongense]|uniref:4-cresol dehydrogenase (Hydroxylating) n=1 Tax=Corynebacterium guangdongense TaxID=1783348 RepID=A0ABU1ZYN3_9CORY|nr:FAD-dependent oxidoreductase [Corynebacterium guangdongense]MDR7329870.1 4-cresol dehydrogenase (hydroxylating) [Corynebacterium guangdongense]WJZ18433.1 4-cresol dehydrogenase [hydroxylating] flavoprotein subunit [Corynebacterium guangdongense]
MTLKTDKHLATLTEELREAARRFQDIVGIDAVLIAPEDVKEFCDPYAGEEEQRFRPSFVVQPDSVDQVQQIVSTAAELGIHLWTSSTGRNYGYGGSAPVVSGSVVLNFRRMNKVLEINEEAGYALIEPGVRFFDLYEAIKAGGHKLWISVPDLGWGSVTGNALDHGYGYTVLGDNASAVCGMEVVLADGQVVRTGFGAIPGSPMWQRHRRGFGPALDSLFMQSNMGIVTKLGIWLMPEPESFTTGSVICADEARIPDLIDALRPLVMDGTIQGHPLITSAPEPPEGQRPHPMDDTSTGSALYKLAATLPPGRINARIAFYGAPSVNDAKEQILREAVQDIPGVTVDLRTYPGTAGAEDIHPLDLVPAGVPNMFLLDMMHKHFGQNIGHVDFSPVLPFDGQAAAEHEAFVQSVLREEDLVAAFGWIVNPRSLVGVCMIFFDTNDERQAAAARRVAGRMLEFASERGWGEYRAHPDLIDRVVEDYRFNDHALHRLYDRIKVALDPEGVLSPGNHGIWGGGHRPQPALPAV